MEPIYYYAKANIDGRCVDLLLTKNEMVRAFSRAKENHGIVDETRGYTELFCELPSEKKKCSIWEKLLGRCDC